MNPIAWLAARGLGVLAGPVVYGTIIAILAGGVWWRVEAWKSRIETEATNLVESRVRAATSTKLEELRVAREALEQQSRGIADALETNREAIRTGIASVLKSNRDLARPVAVADARGACQITPEATQTWNQIQKQLQP